MSESINTAICDPLECPVCYEYYEAPIRQCVKGHSICNKCTQPHKGCPICRQPISQARSFALEELLESSNLPCENSKEGCKFQSKKEIMKQHKLECEFRVRKCEGKEFCNWKCNWVGHNIEEHFKNMHIGNSKLSFNSTVAISYNNSSDFKDIQLIPACYKQFYYKHFIDAASQKAFWVFQLIGAKSKASKYYYEFEILSEAPSIRKFKVTEYCESDQEDVKKIFEQEKCVVISLTALKHFVNKKNEYMIKYRLMKVKNEEDKNSPSKPVFVKQFKPRK